VEYRQVVLGAHIGQSRVITQGLKPDEWVVIEGLQKLKQALRSIHNASRSPSVMKRNK